MPASDHSTWSAALRAHGRDPLQLNPGADTVAGVTQGFTGAELAALVPDAMFRAFADGERAVTADDLVEAARTTTPLDLGLSGRHRRRSVGVRRPECPPLRGYRRR